MISVSCDLESSFSSCYRDVTEGDFRAYIPSQWMTKYRENIIQSKKGFGSFGRGGSKYGKLTRKSMINKDCLVRIFCRFKSVPSP